MTAPFLMTTAATTAILLPVVAGAVVAAVGYVAKLGVETWQQLRERKAAQHAELLRLQALLNASGAAFRVQADLRNRLTVDLQNRLGPDTPPHQGFEELFTLSYDRFTPGEQALHRVIRAYTEFAMYPLNQAVLRWLDEDTHYRGLTHGGAARLGLPEQLNALDIHVRLWLAKYQGWMPDHPEHALVYLDDEKKHGVKFPDRLDATVRELIGSEPSTGA